jgi:hypothetical protein
VLSRLISFRVTNSQAAEQRILAQSKLHVASKPHKKALRRIDNPPFLVGATQIKGIESNNEPNAQRESNENPHQGAWSRDKRTTTSGSRRSALTTNTSRPMSCGSPCRCDLKVASHSISLGLIQPIDDVLSCGRVIAGVHNAASSVANSALRMRVG